jgi:hypothetical protein
MDAEAIAEKILPVVDDPKLADRYHWTAVSLAQGNAVIENHVSHPCPLPHLPPKGKQTVRYYGLYSNKTRGQPPLIPDRIIRPPEFSPNLKSQISNLKSQISNLKSQISNFKFQISNIQSTILLIPAPPKQSARDMRRRRKTPRHKSQDKNPRFHRRALAARE